MGDGGESEYNSSSSLRFKCREKIKKLERDRVNGTGRKGVASSVAPWKRRRRRDCSNSRSPKTIEAIQQVGRAPIFGRRETSDLILGISTHLDCEKGTTSVEDVGGPECTDQAPEDRDENPDFRLAESYCDKKKNRVDVASSSTPATRPGRALGTTTHLDRGKRIIAGDNVEGQDRSDQAPEDGGVNLENADSPVSERCHDNKKNRADVASSSNPATGPGAEGTKGIRKRGNKFEVEIRVAVAKQKSLGFDRIWLGAYDMFEKARIALNVGNFYCGKRSCVPDSVSSLLPLDKLGKFSPKEMKELIQVIARKATLESTSSVSHWHPGRVNAVAPVPQPKTSTHTTHSRCRRAQQSKIDCCGQVAPDVQDQDQRAIVLVTQDFHFVQRNAKAPVPVPKTSIYTTHSVSTPQQVEIESWSNVVQDQAQRASVPGTQDFRFSQGNRSEAPVLLSKITSTRTTPHSLCRPQRVEIEGCRQVEDAQDQAQREENLSNQLLDFDQNQWLDVGPNAPPDDFLNTQELQYQQQRSHGTDSQTLEAPQEATTDVIVDQECCAWDLDSALNPNMNEDQLCTVRLNEFLDQLPALNDKSGNLQDMDLDLWIENGARCRSASEYNLPMADSTIALNNVQGSEVDYTLSEPPMLECDQNRNVSRGGSFHGVLPQIDWRDEYVQETGGVQFQQLLEHYALES